MKKKFNYKNHIMFMFGEEIELPKHDNFGEGLKYKTPDDQKDLMSFIKKDKEGYREITLEISSLLGSIGAVHYYATIKDYSLAFVYVDDPTCSTSGYGTKNVPRQYTESKIEVYRPLTEKDFKHDEEMYAEGYRMLDRGMKKERHKTKGFWTEEAAVKTGIELCKAIFKGKWKLRIEHYSNKKDIVIKLDEVSN